MFDTLRRVHVRPRRFPPLASLCIGLLLGGALTALLLVQRTELKRDRVNEAYDSLLGATLVAQIGRLADPADPVALQALLQQVLRGSVVSQISVVDENGAVLAATGALSVAAPRWRSLSLAPAGAPELSANLVFSDAFAGDRAFWWVFYGIGGVVAIAAGLSLYEGRRRGWMYLAPQPSGEALAEEPLQRPDDSLVGTPPRASHIAYPGDLAAGAARGARPTEAPGTVGARDDGEQDDIDLVWRPSEDQVTELPTRLQLRVCLVNHGSLKRCLSSSRFADLQQVFGRLLAGCARGFGGEPRQLDEDTWLVSFEVNGSNPMAPEADETDPQWVLTLAADFSQQINRAVPVRLELASLVSRTDSPLRVPEGGTGLFIEAGLWEDAVADAETPWQWTDAADGLLRATLSPGSAGGVRQTTSTRAAASSAPPAAGPGTPATERQQAAEAPLHA